MGNVMKFLRCAAVFFSLVSLLFSGEIVTPTAVIATSEFGEVDVFGDGNLSATFVTNLIDGSGLVNEDGTPCTEDAETKCFHDFDANSLTMWGAGSFDAGIANGETSEELDPPNVDNQIVEFDLGRRVRLTHAHIWQNNQGGAFGALAPRRGVEEFEFLVSQSTTGDFVSVGTFTLEPELGEENVPAQVIAVDGGALEGVRRVRFNINTVTSPDPIPEPPHPEFEFVGLSEVRFEAGILGDADLDGTVAFADFLLLSFNFGDPAGWGEGDFDFNGQVSFADFLILSSRFGETGIAAQTVPEPTAALMLSSVLFAASYFRKHR